jgi:hypothetical protein
MVLDVWGRLLMAGTSTQGDMELGAIQIVTQTETTHHVDVSPLFLPQLECKTDTRQVRDMFDPSQKKHTQQVDTKRSDDESMKDPK